MKTKAATIVLVAMALSACGGGGGSSSAPVNNSGSGNTGTNVSGANVGGSNAGGTTTGSNGGTDVGAAGNGSTSGSNTGSNPGGTTIGSTPTPLVLEGTVATGAALSGATISAKCSTGSGTGTSATNGNYSISISNGTLPCVIRATSTDSSIVLHSAIEGSGSGKVIANITPLSELIVTQTHGTDASDLFNQFAATQGKLTPANLNDAKLKVRQALSSIIDLTNVDPIKDSLIAAVGGTGGNDLDKKIDTLRDKLNASDLKLGDLSSLLNANVGATLSEIVKVTLQPRSAACKGLRSGTYRYIEPNAATALGTITIDASTLKIGNVQYLAPNCFLASSTGEKATFGSFGVGVGLTPAGNLALFLPKQNLSLSDLAGTWNFVQRTKIIGSATNYKVTWGDMVFGQDGKASSLRTCDANGCTNLALADLPIYTTSGDGSFTAQDGMRAAAYRAATGNTVLIGIDKAVDSGRLFVARKGGIATLPLISENLPSFEFGISSSGATINPFEFSAYVIQSISTQSASFSRSRLADCRIDTLAVGKPFSQMFERSAGSSPDCLNTPNAITFGDARALATKGLGFGAYVSASSNYFGLTVTTD
jgi:hypothetical protein